MQKSKCKIFCVLIVCILLIFNICGIIYADGVDDLISKLNTASETERIEIVLQLAETGDPRSIGPLIQFGKADKEADNFGYDTLYTTAFDLIGKIAVEPLIQAMKSEDVKVRRFATKAIGHAASIMSLFRKEPDIPDEMRGIADSRAVQPLLEALKDKDKIVQINATYSLMILGREDGLEIAILALDDNNWEAVATAAEALGWSGSEKGLKALEKSLKARTPPINEETLTWVFNKKEDEYIFDTINLSIDRIKYFSSEEYKERIKQLIKQHKDLLNSTK